MVLIIMHNLKKIPRENKMKVIKRRKDGVKQTYHIKPKKPKPKKKTKGTGGWTIITAEKGPDFQEYEYENGDPVPPGTIIGKEKGDTLILKKNIYYKT